MLVFKHRNKLTYELPLKVTLQNTGNDCSSGVLITTTGLADSWHQMSVIAFLHKLVSLQIVKFTVMLLSDSPKPQAVLPSRGVDE